MSQLGIGLFSSTSQNGVQNLNVGTATGATTTLTANNDYYKANAASNNMVFILPAASTVSGKLFTIEKVDSTFNVVTLNDGSNITTLNTSGEAVQALSDGSSYQIINRRIPSSWASASLIPSAGFGTPTGATFSWRRNGDSAEFRGFLLNGTVAASEANFQIGFSIAIDATKINAGLKNNVGDFQSLAAALFGTADRIGAIVASGSTVGFVYLSNGGDVSGFYAAKNGNALFSTGDGCGFKFSVPISGWNG